MSSYYTLLEVVQRVLGALDSDEINSISDTVESDTVTEIVKENFLYIVAQGENVQETTLFELNASGDSTKPTLMTIPSNIQRVDWIKYNRRDTNDDHDIYETLEFCDIDDFLSRTLSYDTSETNIATFDYTFFDTDTIPFNYYNDVSPTFYTIVEGDKVFFNSYDSVVDTTLQKTKTMCNGEEKRVFTKSDTFQIPLDEKQMIWLINECKDQAFAELKQMSNSNAMKKARKMNIASNREFDRKQADSHFHRIQKFGKRT